MSVTADFVLSYACPLCRENNYTLQSQRCGYCGMLMMSDKEYAEIQEEIMPIIERIQDEVKTGKKPQRWRRIQPFLKDLEPYATVYPFAKQFGYEVIHALKEDREEIKHEQMFKLNIFILFILILMPLGAIFLGAGVELWGLLCLPVLGWLWFGVILFRKKKVKKTTM